VICVLTGILAPVTDDNCIQANIAPVATVLCSLLDIDISLLSHSSNVSVAMATRSGRYANCAGSLALLKSDDDQYVVVSLDVTGSVIKST